MIMLVNFCEENYIAEEAGKPRSVSYFLLFLLLFLLLLLFFAIKDRPLLFSSHLESGNQILEKFHWARFDPPTFQ